VSEFDVTGLFAPEGGWRVRILDHSGGAAGGVTEEVGGFPSLMQANAFARRYVRDSVERCRGSDMRPGEVLAAWRAYGEDAEVPLSGDAGWKSAAEISDFAEQPANEEDRDWRALDPRLEDADEEE
jgi:hypothetical protein